MPIQSTEIWRCWRQLSTAIARCGTQRAESQCTDTAAHLAVSIFYSSFRYLAEFQYRFNRRFDLSVILARLLRASSVTSPHPERLIRVAEQCG
jgi:hypothetical protein